MTIEIKELKRREFLLFMGSAALSTLFPTGCTSTSGSRNTHFPLKSLPINFNDQLTTIDGLNFTILIKEGDLINKEGVQFGTNNDYLALIKAEKDDLFYLVVNHESVHPLLSFGNEQFSRDSQWIDPEMKSVGVSILKIQKMDSTYKVVFNDPHNRRIDANSPIPIISERKIGNTTIARGTLANCAGGVTPWGTTLTCEENFADFVGDRPRSRKTIRQSKNQFQWFLHHEMPPEHYGWVVEINPKTGNSKKLTSLGRMAHEGATVTKSKDGRAVVYLGDDDNDRCLYKFISSNSNSLERGDLYVAHLESGKWISLNRNNNPKLKETFTDQTELLIYTREAATLVGGSKLDRPEDIEVDPLTSAVYICLTNNVPMNRPHGSILKIIEENNDAGSLSFTASTFVLGGEETGFSSPDNLAIDRNGNLWLTNDVSGSNIGKPEYAFSGNNGLYFIPLAGHWAGQAIRVASAPKDAEFTGPQFSPDGQSLFLSVQHPGETSTSLKQLTSHWPNGGNSIPKSAVVVLSGQTMEYLLGPDFQRTKI